MDLARPSVRFGPDRRLTALGAVGVLAALAAAALSPDKPGRVLFGVAAAVLLGYVAADLIFWPRLVVEADGLVIRTPAVRTRLGWDEIEDVRVPSRVRRGLRSVTLEIDAGEVLVVLGKRSLGTDPERAAAAVAAYRPR